MMSPCTKIRGCLVMILFFDLDHATHNVGWEELSSEYGTSSYSDGDLTDFDFNCTCGTLGKAHQRDCPLNSHRCSYDSSSLATA